MIIECHFYSYLVMPSSQPISKPLALYHMVQNQDLGNSSPPLLLTFPSSLSPLLYDSLLSHRIILYQGTQCHTCLRPKLGKQQTKNRTPTLKSKTYIYTKTLQLHMPRWWGKNTNKQTRKYASSRSKQLYCNRPLKKQFWQKHKK